MLGRLGLINELWIITCSGLPAYHQTINQQVDETLFGGFISAIQTFVQSFGDHEINKMEMAGSKIIILSSNDKQWLFVGRADAKESEKKVHKYLLEVSDIFFAKFGKTLATWDFNTVKFQELDNLIDIHNPETPSKQSQLKEQIVRAAFL